MPGERRHLILLVDYVAVNMLFGMSFSKYATIAPKVIRAAQQITIRLSQARDSSTVLPDLEKFIRNKHTAAHTTAATVAIPATSV